METLRLVLLVLHLLGFAALFGGLIVQVRTPEKVVNAAMRDGVGTAFLAGLLLVGVLEAGDDPVDHTKIAVKFAIGLVVVAAGGRGISDVVLVGSTAQRVQHYAPCPVLVVRPAPRTRRSGKG